MHCVFCDIISGTLPSFKVWEDERFLAFLDIRPINSGHLLVVPKEHHADAFQMPDELYLDLLMCARVLVPALKAAAGSLRVGLVIEGFSVPHVHVHLVPVNAGNELNPERAAEASQEELKAMQASIRLYLD